MMSGTTPPQLPLPAPREPGRPNKTERRIDLVELYKLRVQNRLSYRELADHFRVAKSSIHAALTRLNRFNPDPESVKAFEGVESIILTSAKERLLASLMDEEAIAKSSLNNRAYAFSQVANHERLVKGQSTANIGIITKLVTQADETLFRQESARPF